MGQQNQRKVSDDEPVMIAWKAYQQTDDYANSLSWAGKHSIGELWAAFSQGFYAPTNARLSAPQEPDDDAEWLRQIAVQGVSNEFSDGAKDRLERIAARLQAQEPDDDALIERLWNLHRRAVSYASDTPAVNMLLADLGNGIRDALDRLQAKASDPLGDGTDFGVTGEWWGSDDALIEAARKLAERTIKYVEPLAEGMECDAEMHALATEVLTRLQAKAAPR